jgi:hypothetical protein
MTFSPTTAQEQAHNKEQHQQQQHCQQPVSVDCLQAKVKNNDPVPGLCHNPQMSTFRGLETACSAQK